MTVGAPLILQVDVYVSPARASVRVAESIKAGRLTGPFGGVEVVRRASLPARRKEAAEDVMVLSEQFILRPLRGGPIEVPAFSFWVGAEQYTTSPHRAHAYSVDRSFFDTRYAIVPVLAQVRDEEARRIFRRNGTAFLVAPNAFVTSYHVVMDAPRVWLFLPNGRQLTVKKAWVVDPVHDVVVLAVDPKDTKELLPLRLAGTDTGREDVNPNIADADVAFTYGWPDGVQSSTAGARYEDVSLGPHERLWVSANPVRPGDSGGPLLNNNGEVLGVVTSGTVAGRRRDVLREEVCLASDLRPALVKKRQRRHPRSLKSIFKDPAFRKQPHVQAFQLSSLLSSGRADQHRLSQWLARFDAAVGRWAAPDPGLHFMQGMIYKMLGHEEDADAAFVSALDDHNGFFPAAYMLAMHHLSVRNFAMAEQLFARTQQFAPYAHLAGYGRARSEMGLMHYERAIPMLEAVLQYDASFAPALYDLAVCHLVLEQRMQVHQLLVRLDGIDRVWANRLRRVLRTPSLRPTVVKPLPRANMPAISWFREKG